LHLSKVSLHEALFVHGPWTEPKQRIHSPNLRVTVVVAPSVVEDVVLEIGVIEGNIEVLMPEMSILLAVLADI
jgi:hypothetical protein